MDDYARERFDRVAEDTAVTRHKVEAMERYLHRALHQLETLEHRVRSTENRLTVVWVLGPVLLAAFAFLQNLKGWLTLK